IYVLPTKQPPRLASSRNRSTSSPLNKDATEMEPCKIRGTTQPLVSRTGAGRQGNIFSFRSREKNVLDFSSYRSPSGRGRKMSLTSPLIDRDLSTVNRTYWADSVVSVGHTQFGRDRPSSPILSLPREASTAIQRCRCKRRRRC